MNSTVRVVDTGVMSARRNIAVTAALAELHRAGRSPDTLRFHRYARSVLIGRNQVLKHELRVGHCRRYRIEIARRVTGGGAVYMTPGVLAWDIIAERGRFGATLGATGEWICRAIASGLSRLGLPAHFRPQNDLVIDGRKLCGACGTFEGPTIVYQGTVLVDVDFARMAAALTPPWAHDDAPTAHTLAMRLTSVAQHLGRVPDMDEVMAVLIAGLAGACKGNVEPGHLTAAELALAQHLHETEIGTDAFVAGDDMASVAHSWSGVGQTEAGRRIAP